MNEDYMTYASDDEEYTNYQTIYSNGEEYDEYENPEDIEENEINSDETNNGYYLLVRCTDSLFHQGIYQRITHSLDNKLIKCKIFDNFMSNNSSNELEVNFKYFKIISKELEISIEKKFLFNCFPTRETFVYRVTHRNKNNFLINSYLTPLIYATKINNTELVSHLLIDFKCDPNITQICKLSNYIINNEEKDYIFFKNLASTCMLNRQDEIDREEERIRKNNEKMPLICHYYSPLMFACELNNNECVKILVDHGADCSFLYCNNQFMKCIYDHTNNKKNTCLYQTKSCLKLAIENFNLQMVEFLCVVGNANIHERLWAYYSSHTHFYTLISKLVKLCVENGDDEEYSREWNSKKIEIFLEEKNLSHFSALFLQNGLKITFNDLFCLYNLLSRTLYNQLTLKAIEVVVKILCRFNFNEKFGLIIGRIFKLCFIKIFEVMPPFEFENMYDGVFFLKIKYYLKLIYLSGFVGEGFCWPEKSLKEYFYSFIEYEVKMNISKEKYKTIFNDLKDFFENELFNKPMGLKQACRIKIKSAMKNYTKIEIDKISLLPNSLKNYLYFYDL
jgi:hypothetical protein